MDAPKTSRVVGLDKILNSTCEIVQWLLRKPRYTALDSHPNLLMLHQSGENGCDECQLLWKGVSDVLPVTGDILNDARAFAFPMTEGDEQWLRLGVHFSGNETTGFPREWVDFRWGFRDADSRAVPNMDFAIKTSGDNIRPSYQTLWLSQIRSWLASCQSRHDICRLNNSPEEMPRRLVDVDLGNQNLDVALRELTVGQGAEPYIALSYCWGETVPLQTTCLTLADHQRCIRWQSLPLLFREAISIARFLQVKFLWIDALCIIQGDAQDWDAESLKMTSYYGKALLTISADAAADTNHPCFPPRRNSPTRLTIPVGDILGQRVVTISKVPLHLSMTGSVPTRRTFSCSPLSDRAWAFQERLTSRRVLHLGLEEMVWECSSSLWCNCGKPPDVWHGRTDLNIQPFRASHHLALSGSKNIALYWQRLLEMYLVRNITYSEDRLKAVMGLARQVKSSQGPGATKARLGHYILGLWDSNFHNSLLWSNLSRRGPRNTVFPSWSWASISGSWLYQPPPDQLAFVPKATILGQPAELWDIDHQRSTQNYELDIEGGAVHARLSCERLAKGNEPKYWELETIPWSSVDMDMLVVLDDEPNVDEDGWDPTVLCLLLGSSNTQNRRSYGLILREHKTERCVYTRVGIMTASEQWFVRYGTHTNLQIR